MCPPLTEDPSSIRDWFPLPTWKIRVEGKVAHGMGEAAVEQLAYPGLPALFSAHSAYRWGPGLALPS